MSGEQAPGPREGSSTDQDLVARSRGGDDSAYAELYRRHAQAVLRYARTCCRESHTAEDLAAEVFVRTLRQLRRGGGPGISVRAYLLTTTRRVAADWSRAGRREHLVQDFEPLGTPADRSPHRYATDTGQSAAAQVMQEAEHSRVLQAFRALPERWRTVLWHTVVEREPLVEVAELMGLTANATAVLAHRAREALRQAYLQAHVSESLARHATCETFAGRLGAYARGALRQRAKRELRGHLADCERCALAITELTDLNSSLHDLVPIALLGAAGLGLPLAASGAAAGTGAAPPVATSLAQLMGKLSALFTKIPGAAGTLIAGTAASVLAVAVLVPGSTPAAGPHPVSPHRPDVRSTGAPAPRPTGTVTGPGSVRSGPSSVPLPRRPQRCPGERGVSGASGKPGGTGAHGGPPHPPHGVSRELRDGRATVAAAECELSSAEKPKKVKEGEGRGPGQGNGPKVRAPQATGKRGRDEPTGRGNAAIPDRPGRSGKSGGGRGRGGDDTRVGSPLGARAERAESVAGGTGDPRGDTSAYRHPTAAPEKPHKDRIWNRSGRHRR
ncbi:sigma-70 family RNA polymerase sigma factor [Streptomyces sp. NPDC048248]|uniref:sigma-70 family RNA polymerase sigma factor n=1 Tax=Streptomyces sp. NPDC048248 TaxID=3365523 RepID=UPI00371252BC